MVDSKFVNDIHEMSYDQSLPSARSESTVQYFAEPDNLLHERCEQLTCELNEARQDAMQELQKHELELSKQRAASQESELKLQAKNLSLMEQVNDLNRRLHDQEKQNENLTAQIVKQTQHLQNKEVHLSTECMARQQTEELIQRMMQVWAQDMASFKTQFIDMY